MPKKGFIPDPADTAKRAASRRARTPLTKKCPKCGETKNRKEDFYWLPSRNQPSSHCKKCSNKNSTDYSRLRLYGMTEEQYLTMLAEQNNACAICKRSASEFNRKLDIDHCHIAGNVRGILCWDCNGLLGKARDDINVLEEAIKYLKR